MHVRAQTTLDTESNATSREHHLGRYGAGQGVGIQVQIRFELDQATQLSGDPGGQFVVAQSQLIRNAKPAQLGRDLQ